MFTMGSPYRGTTGDEFFDYVVALLHFDGTNGTRVYTDKSKYARSVSETGANQLSTVQVKFGTASALFNDGAIFLSDSASLEFGAGNWCIEFFLHPTAYGGWLLSKRDTANTLGSALPPVAVELKGGSAGTEQIRVVLSADGTTYGFDATYPAVGGGAYAVGAWSHIAIVRNGSAITVYRNGVSLGSSAVALTVHNNTEPFSLGRLVTGSYLIGYMDEFRLTVGVPRYTAPFTPAGPFPNKGL